MDVQENLLGDACTQLPAPGFQTGRNSLSIRSRPLARGDPTEPSLTSGAAPSAPASPAAL